MESRLPTKQENRDGLYKKYQVMNFESNGTFSFPPANAEFFVLRLDDEQSSEEHRHACLVAVNAYADAIQSIIPKLASDIRARYKLISK